MLLLTFQSKVNKFPFLIAVHSWIGSQQREKFLILNSRRCCQPQYPSVSVKSNPSRADDTVTDSRAIIYLVILQYIVIMMHKYQSLYVYILKNQLARQPAHHLPLTTTNIEICFLLDIICSLFTGRLSITLAAKIARQ